MARRTAEVEALSGAVADCEQQLRSTADQLSGLRTEICEKEDVISVLEARVQNLEADDTRHRAEITQLRESERALTDETETLRTEAAARADELSVVTSALAEKEAGLRELCSAREQQEAVTMLALDIVRMTIAERLAQSAVRRRPAVPAPVSGV